MLDDRAGEVFGVGLATQSEGAVAVVADEAVDGAASWDFLPLNCNDNIAPYCAKSRSTQITRLDDRKIHCKVSLDGPGCVSYRLAICKPSESAAARRHISVAGAP